MLDTAPNHHSLSPNSKIKVQKALGCCLTIYGPFENIRDIRLRDFAAFVCPTIQNLKLLLLFLLFLPLVLSAQSDNEAREVYEELDRRQRAVVYETATLRMRIVDARGRTRNRELQTWSYNEGDLSRSLVRFLAPADVRGTGLLTLSEGDTEVQRLFLPALNRVQVIAGNQRSDRFMGSDFTYEDLGDLNPDHFEFSVLIKDRDVARMEVRGVRTVGSGGYATADFLIDTERFVLLRARYYDAAGKPLRELSTDSFTEIRTGIWRAGLLTMRDLTSGRFTELEWVERTLDEPIPADVFTERNLQRL
jgi:hypothetical protein